MEPFKTFINLTPYLSEKDKFEKRFWSYVDKSGGVNECWPWIGGKNTLGYGKFKIASYKMVMANRLAFALATNFDPGEKLVCHSCDNPPCCNPTHLWLGTARENNLDCFSKNRHTRAFGRNVPRNLIVETRQ